MPHTVTDRVRTLVDQVLSSTEGNQYRPIKLLREVLGTANDLAGRPFCSQSEIDRKRARRAAAHAVARSQPAAPVVAPVMVYFDGKDHRTLDKVQELLKSRGVPFQLLDVTDDESTRSWASTTARNPEFPLVFIAGEPIGGLHELTQSDVSGELKRRVFV